MRVLSFCKVLCGSFLLISLFQSTIATSPEINQSIPITNYYPVENGFNFPEKKIVVVITSYKNKDWYRANLDSVYNQNYQNYRVIYLDDNSPDGTGKLVEAYIKEKGQEHRTTLIQHTEWQSQMGNHYNAVYMCADDEIVCHLDGDDYLSSPQTLQIVNAVYQNDDVWVTFGLPIKSDTNELCNDSIPELRKQEITASNHFRLTTDGWPYSHLRTFRVWLFKQIKLEDLMFEGNFANMSPCPDVAMEYPMLEMAGFHNRVLTNRLYVWNVKNPISQRIITPLRNILKVDHTIRFQWPVYEPLSAPILNYSEQFKDKKCDVIVLCPGNNNAELESTMRNTIDNIKDIYFISHDNSSMQSVQSALKKCSTDWIILCDGALPKTHRDATQIILELERTFAYSFHLHRSLTPELGGLKGFLTNDIIAWQPQYTLHIWPQPEVLGAILYRKRDILERLDKMASLKGTNFIQQWAQYQLPTRTACLFYRY